MSTMSVRLAYTRIEENFFEVRTEGDPRLLGVVFLLPRSEKRSEPRWYYETTSAGPPPPRDEGYHSRRGAAAALARIVLGVGV